MYQPFLLQVQTVRERAATFFRADLHSHSNESGDFPKLGDKPGCATTLAENDRNPSPAHYIAAAKKAGLQLLVVTDHNKSKIAEQIAALSDEAIVVLPGMEVTLKTSFFPDSVIHVLTIFPEKYGNADIERAFANSGIPIYAERKHDSVLDMAIPDFVKAIHAQKGICIASHVNSDKGIRSLFRQSNVKLLKIQMRKRELQRQKEKGLLIAQEELELGKLLDQSKEVEDEIQNSYLQFLAENEFDAVEVQKSSDKQFYTGTHVDELGIRPIPCIVGSDAHSLGDIGLSGFTTYIKMTQPSFADLQRALRDPGTRLRFEDDVPHPPIARILGIQFEGGFFHGHTIGFSDNLSCLIGGRGSGKSATIDALRHVLSQATTHLNKDKQNDIHGRLEHTLKDTDIKIVFVDHNGDTYVVKRRYGENRSGLYEIDGTARTEIDVGVASNLRVKIFGWGEVEELARSKRDQLLLIDGFVPGVNEAKDQVQDWLRALSDNTSRVLTLAGDIQTLLPRVAELPSKRSLLSKLSTDALNKIFSEYDKNQQAQVAIETVATTLTEIRRSLVQPDGTPIHLEEQLQDALARAQDGARDFHWFNDFETQFSKLASSVEEKYNSLLADLQRLVSLTDGIKTQLESDQSKIESDLNRSSEAEGAETKSMLSSRKTLTEEVNSLQSIQDQIDQKQHELDELLKDRWTRIVPELQRVRREVTKLRRAKIKEINAQLLGLSAVTKVSVTLLHQKERKAFVLALGSDEKDAPEGVLKYVYKFYRRDKYAELYAKRHSPHTFVKSVLDEENDPECDALRAWAITEDGQSREVINAEKARDVRKHMHPRLEESRYFDREKLRHLLELEHSETEDLPQICLDGKPIEELSPGQRCSALIPIILLESDCPLIIDQPEDNLDNKLVFSLVVDIIRGLKEKRQIIVATHNPNIPVSGDAEQIVVFEAPTRRRCERIIQGSIDCDDIVAQVKAIMEGSEEAFHIRAEKYGYRMPRRKSG